MTLLNVGARALQAQQAALQVTGHNIANVNTVGYSRQTASMRTMPGQLTAGGYIGKGVDLEAVMRSHSELLNRQAGAAAAVDASDSARLQRLKQLQDVFSGGTSGLGSAISDMMNAFSDVVSSPTDLNARNVVLTRMDETARRMRDASGRMDEIALAVNQQLNGNVDKVNGLASEIAGVNLQIMRARGNGQQPNDLLDRRDQLIREVNKYIQTTQVPAEDGSLTVFVASSQPLVMADQAAKLSIGEPLEFNTTGAQKKLLFTSPNGQEVIEMNDTMLGGGEISGLLRFQNGDLSEGRNLLGRMAITVSEMLNSQNKLGLTLDGKTGENLFKPVSLGNAIPGKNNITTTMGLEVLDASKLEASDYDIVFVTGGGGTVTRLSDGKILAFADVNELNSVMASQGIKLTDGSGVSPSVPFAAGADNDKFRVMALQGAAGQMSASQTSPRQLAVANQINAAMGPQNDGSLQLVSLQAIGKDASGNALALTPPAIGSNVTISFAVDAATKAVTYSIDGTDMGAYVPGQAIQKDGWAITLNGLPKDKDSVIVGNALDPRYAGYYQRDAGNASAMMDLRDEKLFDGATLTDGFSSAMARIGTRTQSAQFAADLSATIAGNLERERTAISGVNLDEEAARLIQYQQSYQASAKMVQIAQNIFDSLIQSVGR